MKHAFTALKYPTEKIAVLLCWELQVHCFPWEKFKCIVFYGRNLMLMLWHHGWVNESCSITSTGSNKRRHGQGHIHLCYLKVLGRKYKHTKTEHCTLYMSKVTSMESLGTNINTVRQTSRQI